MTAFLPNPDVQDTIVDAILMERQRQEEKCEEMRAAGEPWLSCAEPENTDQHRLAVLGEEHGEVCRALADATVGRPGNLREELVHLAAVAFAWLEYLEARA